MISRYTRSTSGYVSAHTVILLGVVATVTGALAAFAVGESSAARLYAAEAAAYSLALSAVEQALWELDRDPSYTTGETSPDSFPKGENRWALDAASWHAPVLTEAGEFVAVKPANRDVVYGVGYVPSQSSQWRVSVVRATYAFTPARAILSGGSILLDNGGISIRGVKGGVHANGNLEVREGAEVDEDVTASGMLLLSPLATVHGVAEERTPEIPMPFLPIGWVESRAEYIMDTNGWVLAGPANTQYPPGTRVCRATPGRACYGWFFEKMGPAWRYAGTGQDVGVFDARTNVIVAPPAPMSSWSATILARGSIDIRAGTTVLARAANTAVVAQGDVRISDSTVSGWIFAAEQVEVVGSILFGGVIARSDLDDSPLVGPGSKLTPSVQRPTTILNDGLPLPEAALPAQVLALVKVVE